MKRIFVTGDLHSSATEFNNRIAQIDNPTEEDVIICAGDVGIEYGNYTSDSLKRAMKEFPGTIIVMRGNHDNCYWKKHGYLDDDNYYHFKNNSWEFADDNELFIHQKKYPNIWYVDDNGGIYTINEYNILFLPGAYSVDKYYRIDNEYPWNPEEQLTNNARTELYDIVKKWIDLGFNIDFIVGHTFPYKLEKYYKDLFMENVDQTIIDKTTENWLDDMSSLYEKSSAFKHYFGGHFHADRTLNNKYTMLFQTVKNLADYT